MIISEVEQGICFTAESIEELEAIKQMATAMTKMSFRVSKLETRHVRSMRKYASELYRDSTERVKAISV